MALKLQFDSSLMHVRHVQMSGSQNGGELAFVFRMILSRER